MREFWGRQSLTFKLLAGVLALVLIWALLGSERLWVLNSRPMVVHISSIKTAPDMADLVGEIDGYGIHLRREDGKAVALVKTWLRVNGFGQKPASFDHMTDPAIGYSVREWGFVGMPFAYETEYGPVLYVRNDWGTIYGPLNPSGFAKLNAANGRDVTQVGLYPFWTHTWGWLFLLGLALAFWLVHRANVRRREELGLID